MTEQSIHQDEEIWKPIVGYEGHYEVSNLGRVRSVTKLVNGPYGSKIKKIGKINKPFKDTNGYLIATLCVQGKCKKIAIHRLVATNFINGNNNGLVVNHKDRNILNNKIDNLEFVSVRENACHGGGKKLSMIGASFHKRTKKWRANIYVNKKQVYIGCFNTEKEASEAYKKYIDKNGLENKYYK